LRDGHDLLSRIFRQLGGRACFHGGGRRCDEAIGKHGGCRIGQRLSPKLQVTEGDHRDKHKVARTHPGTKASIAKQAALFGTRAAQLWQQTKVGFVLPRSGSGESGEVCDLCATC